MLDAANVGAALGSAMKYGVPNVEKNFPGQGHVFMQAVMEQLAGLGVPGAQGLLPKTPVLGGMQVAHEHQHSSPSAGASYSSRGASLG